MGHEDSHPFQKEAVYSKQHIKYATNPNVKILTRSYIQWNIFQSRIKM